MKHKRLKIRVRFYPGEYSSYRVEVKKGWFKWETQVVFVASGFASDSEAKKAALIYMNNYLTSHKQYITEPYTVDSKEYILNKVAGDWNEVFRSSELDISL